MASRRVNGIALIVITPQWCQWWFYGVNDVTAVQVESSGVNDVAEVSGLVVVWVMSLAFWYRRVDDF